MGAGWWGEDSSFAFIFLLASCIYNTSVDVKTICFVPHSHCVIVSSPQCSPSVSCLAQDHFQRLNFQSKYTHKSVVFSKTEVITFFQGGSTRERRMLRIECEFISHGRSHKDGIPKCAAKLNRSSREEVVGEDSEASKAKGTTLAKCEV